MEDPPEEEISVGGESPVEIIAKICEEMKGLLVSAEALLQSDLDDSTPDEVEEA